MVKITKDLPRICTHGRSKHILFLISRNVVFLRVIWRIVWYQHITIRIRRVVRFIKCVGLDQDKCTNGIHFHFNTLCKTCNFSGVYVVLDITPSRETIRHSLS